MEEIKIEFKELDEFAIEDTREVVIKEVPVYPELENLTVTPSGEEQVFNHENSYGYDEVRVEAVPSEALEVNPTTENQEYNGMYNNVKVNAVTSEIDSNIVPENIKNDVEILGVKGNFVGSKYAPRYINFRDYKGTELDYEVANLDTSNIINMSNMFYSLASLSTLDLSNFNTSNVNDMYSMFYNCSKLTSLNVSNFNTINVTNMSYMFYGCSKLTSLDIRNFTFDKVTSYSSMFSSVKTDCLIIVKGDTEKEWITSKFTTLTNVKTVAEYETS